jgi:hypothetical protein
MFRDFDPFSSGFSRRHPVKQEEKDQSIIGDRRRDYFLTAIDVNGIIPEYRLNPENCLV